jgi:putative ABC transport system permease protein
MLALRALTLVIRRSLKQHRLAGSITSFCVALATALLLTVTSLQFQAEKAMAGQAGGFDAVLGARGSPLQLVLASLYHLENSPGNLPWSLYQSLARDPQVKSAIPIALGDNYLGFRIIGTLPEFFAAWDKAGARFAQGRAFDPSRGEAVIGSWVAEKTGLRIGSRFHPYHGLNYDASAKHAEEYEVVGILESTNSPQDRVLWIPLEGIFRMSGHVLRGQGQEFTPQAGQAIPDQHKEVSAVLLKFRSPQIGMHFDQMINRQGKVATLAWPVGRVVFELFDKLGWMTRVLQLTTFMVLMVAAASITAALCNTLHERRREFAILRALGAGRGFVSLVLVGESTWLSGVGAAWGFGVYLILMYALTGWLRAQTGIHFEPMAYHPGLIWGPALVVGLGVVAGLLPTALVYRGSLAPDLGPTS